MIAFGLDLGIGHSLIDEGMLNGGIFIHTRPLHNALNTVTAKAANNLVFQGSIKARTARVSLPSCPSPELIINAPGFVVLGTYNVKPAQLNHLIMLFLPFCFTPLLRIATKDNIHTPPGHICGHSYRLETPGLGDYSCLLFMMLGI